jgi:hypothetical protein
VLLSAAPRSEQNLLQDELKLQAQRLVPALDVLRWEQDLLLRKVDMAHRGDLDLPKKYWQKYRVVEPTYEHVMDLLPGTELHEVLSTGGRPEVWGRPLQGGRYALLFFNNGVNSSIDITCDASCWSQTGFSPSEVVQLRDVWSHTYNGTTAGSVTVTGVRSNATVVLTLTPSSRL